MMPRKSSKKGSVDTTGILCKVLATEARNLMKVRNYKKALESYNKVRINLIGNHLKR